MNAAQEFVKKLSRKSANYNKIEAQMKEDCIEHIFDEPRKNEGWGDITIWKFSDRSYVSYDGRGYIARVETAKENI